MTPRSNPHSLVLDAYTADEFGPKNTSATIDPARPREQPLLSKSRFTWLMIEPNQPLREVAQTLITLVPNKADPRVNPGLTVAPQRNIRSSDPVNHQVWLYLSPSTTAYANSLAPDAPWERPIQVSILYGVGFEMNRHGLRTAVANATEPSALLLISGIEPERKGDPRFGVAINESDLRKLLEAAVARPVQYRTKVLAAFSTGINGLNQTLLNGLIDVSRVERIVIYDCLYLLSSGGTADALLEAKRRAGQGLKIIVYKCTTGGNSLEADNRLSVVVRNPGLIKSEGVIDQLWYVPAYGALITYRSLEGGIKDGLVTLPAGSKLEAAYNAMTPIVPPRGAMISSKAAWRYVYGSASAPSGKRFFEDWASDKANDGPIRNFHRHIGSVTKRDTIRFFIWSNHLPGWPGGDGEENHDLLLPDFGWEFLPA